jgi:protoporphyrinogen oxidase
VQKENKNTVKQKIGVIGAGPMGLACAYKLLKAGYAVEIFEADDRIGGMSASFDFDGMKIERYYHFICAPDQPLFDMLDELGVADKLRWRETRQGYFFKGKLYRWGEPWALLAFPHLNIIQKIRYALHVMYAKSISDWRKLDKISATQWLTSWLGEKTYMAMWHNLFYLKFFEYKDQLSAAWLGTRIKRVALSRKSLFREKLGYLEGGSDTFLDAIEAKIREMGGIIHLSCPVRKVLTENGKVTGLQADDNKSTLSNLISTVPLPYVPRFAPDLPREFKERITSIENIGVVCVLFKLNQPLTDNFWMNIQDDDIKVPGVIEYSNLNPLGNALVYVPFYMPKTHPDYSKPDADFLQRSAEYLKKINPSFSENWILASKASRYEFAQTICPPDFYAKLPPMKTPLDGFYMADTSYYYPEDRSISESIRVGFDLAEAAQAHAVV